MTRTDRLLCLTLFVVLSSIYFATVSGITCSNDGSHYALTRVLAEEGRFTIESYDGYAEGNDVAVRDGKLYSDRPPGTALMASAFYGIGNWLPSPLIPLESRHDPGNPRLLYVMLVPVWAGTGTVLLLYLLLRELNLSVFSALTASVAFALGTAHWKYSSVLFSHAPSALLVLSSVYLVVRMGRTSQRPWSLPFALGLLAGCSVLVEYFS
ncbi:MAG: phospholipid carrier-dependent glycosyltransferase, partial [Anaerolineae bacterium]|nr:phospholipid carrier-dependent glycosyltransferase [Anaerolineae bacterium]